MPADIVQAVAGVLVTFVACWELYCKRNWFLSLCKKKNADVEAPVKEDKEPEEIGELEDNVDAVEVETITEPLEQQFKSSDEGAAANDDNGNNDDECDPESVELEEPATAANPEAISSIYALLAVEPTRNSTTDISTSDNNTYPTNVNEVEELKIGMNKATFITLLAGGASGFLGGW